MLRLVGPLALLAAVLVTAVPVAGDAPGPVPGPAGDPPLRILIIRHAEKPDDRDDPHLSARGRARAAALARVVPERFARPDFVVAARTSAHSNRSVETVTPLAESLRVPVDDALKDEQSDELARRLLTDRRYAGKVVLVCWHHGKIPDVARALGAAGVPAKWKDPVFDRVWEVTFRGGKATLADLPQKALPGDAAD
ncbi:MAG TPA: histidine phosphatase family protein [Humisphaera sp.]